MSGIDATTQLLWMLREWGLPQPKREFRFHPDRKWRFDLAWEDQKVAVEIEGVFYRGWRKSRHQTGVGMERDLEKYNAATALGWRLYRFSPKQAKQLSTVETLAKALRG